jgi:transcriptional regulator with XRE-family HTH domain
MKTEIDPALTTPCKNDRNRGLGTVLRQLRRNASATQADIATALGLERTSVCNIESGIQALTIEKLHDFAERVGVEVVVTFRPKRRAKLAPKTTVVLGEAAEAVAA